MYIKNTQTTLLKLIYQTPFIFSHLHITFFFFFSLFKNQLKQPKQKAPQFCVNLQATQTQS